MDSVKPTYEEQGIQLYLGDCLEIMKSIPDKSIDLVLTDPPYGIGFDREYLSMSCGMRKDGSQRKVKTWNNPKPKNYETKNWDKKPSQEIFSEIFRVSKKQIIWGGNYFDLPKTGGWLIWDKQVSMPKLSKCEMAWTSFLGHSEIIRYLWAGYRKAKPEQRFHPTQKPKDVMKWSLKQCPYYDVSLTILDPFMGSGTTGVACKELGRNFIGIEIEPKYYEIAKRRIQQTTKNLL